MSNVITADRLRDTVNGIQINTAYPSSAKNYTALTSRKVEYLVAHYTGNEKDVAFNNARYFQTGSRGASAHFFVDNTSIYQSVQLKDRAWHCGSTVGYVHKSCRNNNSIGVEMCCSGDYTISDKTKENAAYLFAHLCRLVNIGPDDVNKYVLRHWDVTGKSCPLQMKGADNAEWTAFKQAIRDILRIGKIIGTPSMPVLAVEKDSPAAAFTVKVTASKLNVRSGPGTTYEVVTQASKDDVLTIVETSLNNWGKLKSGAGWISLDYAERMEPVKSELQKPLALIAQEVINGKWGNGDERQKALTAAGYNPAEVQKLVNALCGSGIRVQVTVKSSSTLTIRQNPDSGSKKLDVFGPGVFVTVEEVREGPGASAWGRVGNGWISLDYVAVI